jgi:hypothetical protein
MGLAAHWDFLVTEAQRAQGKKEESNGFGLLVFVLSWGSVFVLG